MVRVLSSELSELQQRRVTVHDDEFDIDVDISIIDLFTSSSCHILAAELGRLIEGSNVIAVHAAGDWPGGYLIHAGVTLAEQVFDVEGAHDTDVWIERWSRGIDVEVTRQAPADYSQACDPVVLRTARETARMLFDVPEFKSAKTVCLQF